MTQRSSRFTDLESLKKFLASGECLNGMTVVDIDLKSAGISWSSVDVKGTFFLGCVFEKEKDSEDLRKRGATIIDRFSGREYNPFRTSLYSREELLRGNASGTSIRRDVKIYEAYLKAGGRTPGIQEALSQRIHDYAIDASINDLLVADENGDPTRNVVAVAGGHQNIRGSIFYKKTAELARALTRDGYLIATGGGPGIMEAANLGAYLACKDDLALDDALAMLKTAIDESKPEYFSRAWEVVDKYPNGSESLSIPTWYYGFEQTNQFASHIAKYFANSIREDGLLTIALSGVVYAPGSAGTRQEVFMDAAQNHYGTLDGKYDWFSPMVFLGTYAYQVDTSIYQILNQSANSNYKDLLKVSDDIEELRTFIRKHPPIKKLHAGG